MPTALVVDDDPTIRDLFSTTLELEGWTVVTAIDGQDALEQLADPDLHVDVILLDMMMPRMSGLQVLQEMVRDERLNAIPRIVVSAKDDSLERQFALSLGAAAWLSKPITPTRLLAAVEDYESDVVEADVIEVHEVPQHE